MKKAFIILSLGLFFASCGSRGDDPIIALQKQVDSLTQLVPASIETKNENFSTNITDAAEPPFSDYYVLSEGANKQIQDWHSVLKNGDKIDWEKNKGRTAFMIPASTLKHLINDLNSKFVVFYIGIDKNGSKEMSLFYTGVKINNDSTLSETPLINEQGMNCVFDLGYPCPKCVSIGIHESSAGIGGTPPATFFAQVIGGNGKISPDGETKVYDSRKSVSYTFKPDPNYQVGEVKVNDSVIRSIGNTYTFSNAKGSNIITVRFSPSNSPRKK